MHAGIEEQSALYQKRIPIFPRAIQGRFRRFKWWILALSYGVFFGLVWLPWPRGHDASQAILLDIAARKFYLFNLVVYPEDFIWLSLLLFIAAAFLFFVTSLVGRAFCGYFCFQTLWTDFFIWVEQGIQGERPARIRLYKQPWHAEKILKIGATHAIWLLMAAWTAFTFAAYFSYAPQLLRDVLTGHAPLAAYVTIAILTLTTYLAAGLAREQICTYICPYARFQSVMYDPETLTVSYDERRGEGKLGRASWRQGLRTQAARQAAQHGDCIDCTLCVQVCPAGIDIRNGLQYACISCGLCIDACDSIMRSVGFPVGLIRYDAETTLQKQQAPRLHWKRLKVLGYGAAILSMSVFLVYSVASRVDFDQAVIQIRQPLFVLLSDGEIRNRYQLRIGNRSAHDETYRLSVRGLPAGAVDFGNFPQVSVKSGKSLLVQASVKLSREQAQHIAQFEFVITPLHEPRAAQISPARFYFEKEQAS